MGRALSARKIWGRSYVWYRLRVDLAQIRGLLVGVDRGRYEDKIALKRAKKAAKMAADASSASSSSELNLAGGEGSEGRMRGGSNDNISVDYFFVSGIYCSTTSLELCDRVKGGSDDPILFFTQFLKNKSSGGSGVAG
jgi:hypothetical protein